MQTAAQIMISITAITIHTMTVVLLRAVAPKNRINMTRAPMNTFIFMWIKTVIRSKTSKSAKTVK